MSSPSPHIKVKLIVSYVIFLMLLLVILFSIYQKVRSYTTIDQSSQFQTDSIVSLIEEKDHRILDLIQSIGDLNSNFIKSSQELENYLSETTDSPVIQKKIITTSDTIVSKEKGKRLLERLVEAFIPEEDNTVEVKTRVETMIDTVYDTGLNRDTLEKLQQKLRKERIAFQKRQQQTNELKQLNTQITHQIDSIINSYEKAQLNNLLDQVERSNLDRKSAIQWIGGVAIASIILIIVFSSLLLRDINKSNLYRRKLEQANKRSAELLRAREKLMLTITHDIKAPVGTIMGYSELLHLTSLSPNQIEYLSSIDIASDHILRLIQDLLDYHLLDLNKVELRKESFHLKVFIEEILESFTPLYNKKSLELSANYIDEDLDIWIKADENRIKQVLNNLLSNALKFTDNGSVNLRVKIDGERLILIVKDTGRGMNEDDKLRIFNEFTRLPSAQGKEGFGLGLSIVSKIVQAMNGLIRVDSVIDKGTTFTVVLPYEVGEKFTNQNQALIKDRYDSSCLSNYKIIVMDDDNLQLKLTKAVLEKDGAKVTTCNTLNSLLEALDNTDFSLLITDIQMPEITGYDLACLLKNSNKSSYNNVPMLAVSAQEQIDQSKLLESGFVGVLKKPFTAKDVAKVLDCIEKGLFIVNDIEDFNSNIADNKHQLAPLFAFAGGDAVEEREIVASFIAEFEKNLQILSKGMANNDLELIAKTAHKMIPVIKMLHQDEICNALVFLDKKIIDYTFEECKDKVVFIQQEISNLVLDAKEYLS